MRELRISNEALSDGRLLKRRFDEDGYLFFRDVLDQAAVTTLRDQFLDVLVKHGVVAEGSSQGTPNGRVVDAKAVRRELDEHRLWETFVALPSIDAFFIRVFGEPVNWAPIAVYRYTQLSDPGGDIFAGRHQDGFFNRGLNLRVVWIPLVDIDESVGGLAIAAGMHKRGYLHDASQPPNFPIPADAIPLDAWHRTTYQPGDVVIFHEDTPHAGLPNRSDRVRLSIDIRPIPVSEPQPLIGTIVAAHGDSVTVRTDDTHDVHLRIDDDTYIRGDHGQVLTPADLSSGTSVIVASRDGVATFIRPPK